MASAIPFLADGGNINKPPCFIGECYDFWKIHMQMYLEAQGEEICMLLKWTIHSYNCHKKLEEPTVKGS